MLLNLLSNAFKFTTEGFVYIGIKPVILPAKPQSKHISSKTSSRNKNQQQNKKEKEQEEQEQELCVHISDSGCGVPPNVVEKLFTKFEQGASLKVSSAFVCTMMQCSDIKQTTHLKMTSIFFRLFLLRTRTCCINSQSGSGVGLALSQQIAHLLGGEIKTHSPYLFTSSLQPEMVQKAKRLTKEASGLCKGTLFSLHVPYHPFMPGA